MILAMPELIRYGQEIGIFPNQSYRRLKSGVRIISIKK